MKARIYIMKSKAGHYHASARKGAGGSFICRSLILHGTKESARIEVQEKLLTLGYTW